MLIIFKGSRGKVSRKGKVFRLQFTVLVIDVDFEN